MSDPFFIFKLGTNIKLDVAHAKRCMDEVYRLRQKVDTRDAIIKHLQEQVRAGIMERFGLKDKLKARDALVDRMVERVEKFDTARNTLVRIAIGHFSGASHIAQTTLQELDNA